MASAAVRVADSEGLSALSMRRLASELGFATMSLYNYVRTKDDLLQRMADHVVGELDVSASRSQDTKAGIVALARAYRDLVVRHPWLSEVSQGPPWLGPNTLRYLDHFVGLLVDSRLTLEEKLEFIALVTGFALTYARMLGGGREAMHRKGGDSADPFGARAAELLAAAASGKYPNLKDAVAVAAPADMPDPDEVFDASVKRLIEGAELP